MVEIEGNFKNKNGSFYVSVPVARNLGDNSNCMYPKEFEQVGSNKYIVQMLTQNDYAEGWRQIVPSSKKYYKKIINTEGETSFKSYLNSYRMKINLAQLPEYLWHRMQYVDENTKSVNNGIYSYLIEATNVDEEIIELANILKNPPLSKFKERVQELLTILKDNDVYGWLIIRAKHMY